MKSTATLTRIAGGLIALTFVLGAAAAVAQSSPPSPVSPSPSIQPNPSPPKATPDADVILKLQTELHQEAKEFREYLENSMLHLQWMAGALVFGCGVIFGLLNYKSGKDIRAQVNKRFQTTFDAELSQRLKTVDTLIEDNTQRTEAYAKKTEKVAADQLNLTEQFAELAADLTFAYQIMQNEANTNEWNVLRRQAQARLEHQRQSYPHLRAVGVLLGRIHKYFKEYEKSVAVLTGVMDARDGKRLPKNQDYGALLYNRACYRSLAADVLEGNKSKREAESRRNEAWEDLFEACKLDPMLPKVAQDDKDFRNLWNAHRTSKELGEIELPATIARGEKKPARFWQRLFRRGEK